MGKIFILFSTMILMTMMLKLTETFPADCFQALGMQSGEIEDDHISVSSSYGDPPASGKYARLNKNILPWGGWCPHTLRSKTYIRYDKYIEIDLLHVTKITMVATQGRVLNGAKEFTRTYRISYSEGGCQWIFYKGNASCLGEVKTLKGNEDRETVVTSELNPPIIARYIRIHPGYRKGEFSCLRLELYGCRSYSPDSMVQEPKSQQVPNASRPKVCTEENVLWSWPLITSTSIAAFFFLVSLVLTGLLIRSKQKYCTNCRHQSFEMTQPKLSKDDIPEYDSITINTCGQTNSQRAAPECLSEDIGNYDDVFGCHGRSEKMEENKFGNDYEYEYDNEVIGNKYETMDNRHHMLMKSLGARLQMPQKREKTDCTELDGMYENESCYENIR